MTLPRYAFIKANWHADIVERALTGFAELIPLTQVDVFDTPGAFEMPLLARDLAAGQGQQVFFSKLVRRQISHHAVSDTGPANNQRAGLGLAEHLCDNNRRRADGCAPTGRNARQIITCSDPFQQGFAMLWRDLQTMQQMQRIGSGRHKG